MVDVTPEKRELELPRMSSVSSKWEEWVMVDFLGGNRR